MKQMHTFNGTQQNDSLKFEICISLVGRLSTMIEGIKFYVLNHTNNKQAHLIRPQ